MNQENETNRTGYYSVIPATVLYAKELKSNEKLLYAIITSLSNKEGYCYATNKYLAGQLGVKHDTISGWISHLREKNFLYVEVLRNEKQEIIYRKIYPNDIPSRINIRYPFRINMVEGIGQKSEDNNIIYNNINTLTVVKKNYAESVTLYEHEYKQLVEKYGTEKSNKCIEELNLYKKSKGVEYDSDYATIKRWVILRVEELEQRQDKKKDRTNNKSYIKYEQREYPPEFFESLYENIPPTTSNIIEENEMDLDM